MKEHEIEKLRKKLGDEFDVTKGYNCAVITVKDIWKGVEFAECMADVKVDRYSKEIAKGQIYRIVDWFKREVIYIDKDELGWQSKHFQPSNESAYVEQLKAKAKELYGEIKDGDRFDRSDMGFDNRHKNGIVSLSFNGWDYCKKDDSLFFGSICIYLQGKWSKKIPQCIVTPIEIHSEEPDIVGDQVISLQMKIIHGHISQKNRNDVAYYLSKCLEDYLNKSQ